MHLCFSLCSNKSHVVIVCFPLLQLFARLFIVVAVHQTYECVFGMRWRCAAHYRLQQLPDKEKKCLNFLCSLFFTNSHFEVFHCHSVSNGANEEQKEEARKEKNTLRDRSVSQAFTRALLHVVQMRYKNLDTTAN